MRLGSSSFLLSGKTPRRVRELARHVLGQPPEEPIAVVAVGRRRDTTDLEVREARGHHRLVDLLTSYLIGERFVPVLLEESVPNRRESLRFLV
jgi:hypothetical protein